MKINHNKGAASNTADIICIGGGPATLAFLCGAYKLGKYTAKLFTLIG